MPNIGGPEILFVLLIVLIVFGAGRLPEVLGQLGKGVNEFRRQSSGEDKDKDTVPKSTTSSSSSTEQKS